MSTMHACNECDFKARNNAGLSSHKRRHKILAMQASATTDEEVIEVAEMETSVAPATPINKHAKDVDAHVCKDCHVLPIGSVELVGLLLVLVFALSAVLLTSIYVIETRI